MEFPENFSSASEDEYSEDEEFLAWKNYPEVKRRIEEQKEKRDEAIHRNSELINKTDQTEVDAQVKAQVELLGSKILYYRISSKFRDYKFEPYFVR